MSSLTGTLGKGHRTGRLPLIEAVLLLTLAVVAAGAAWLLGPNPLPLLAESSFYELELSAPLVSVADALELYASGEHLFVDTRPEAGTLATIPGSFIIREDAFEDDLRALFDFLYPEDPVILFGDGNLSAASNIAARLQEREYLNLVIMQGGIDAWAAGGGEISEGSSAAAVGEDSR